MHPDHVRRAARPPGPSASGLVGGYTSACTTRPYLPFQLDVARNRQVGLVGRVIELGAQYLEPRRGHVHPYDRQRLRSGRPPGPTIDVPSADSTGANSVIGRSRSVSSEVSGSSTPSRMLPRPCTTARRPSPSTANGRAPSCHSGPANSSSAGYSACGGSPGQPDLVDVPPAGPVRHHVQAGVVPPGRGQHRLAQAALDQPALANGYLPALRALPAPPPG